MDHSPETMRGARVSVAMLAFASGAMAVLNAARPEATKLEVSEADMAASAASPWLKQFEIEQEDILTPPPTTTTIPPTTIPVRVVEPKPSRSATRQSAPKPAKVLPPPAAPVSGNKVEWMEQAGIAPSDRGYVDYIMTKESSWVPSNVNSKGCIGLGQNCPNNGYYWLKEACPDWQTDPVCQLGRFATYAVGRYGSWQKAFEFKRARGWW